MEIFSALLAFVRGIRRRIPPTKASDTELWCFLCSAPWINKREADDLRRHRVIVMVHTEVPFVSKRIVLYHDMDK